MDDLGREIAAIREELRPEWDEARSERLFAGVGRLQRRRRAQRVFGSTAAVAVAVAAVVGLQSLSQDGRGPAPLAESAAGRELPAAAPQGATLSQPSAAGTRVAAGQRARLADGSSAQLVSETGTLEIVRDQPEHLELTLSDGLAHFEVVKNPHRAFLVNAGRVQVVVIGTVFDVEQTERQVRVTVSEGKVRVETPAGTQHVAAGESAWFDAQGARIPTATDPTAGAMRGLDNFQDGPARATAAREPNVKSKRTAAKDDRAPTKVSWRSLCQSGDYDAAYRLLESGTPVENDPAALMDAADAARLSNHPEASVTYLRRVLRDHVRSPVAPLAGFTLGRVLLERLGQPSEAAEAFAFARRIAPQGSLAQDALAREVEAWSKAGNSHEAYQRAQLYVQLYPAGRRLRAVRLYGGL